MQNMIEMIEKMAPHERANFLLDNASSTEEGVTYQRQLTPDELTELKELFAERSVIYEQKNDDFNDLKKELKAELDVLKADLKQQIGTIKTGREIMRGNLYYLDDQENGEMYVFDGAGNLIEKRKLRQNEKQKTIFSIAPKVM